MPIYVHILPAHGASVIPVYSENHDSPTKSWHEGEAAVPWQPPHQRLRPTHVTHLGECQRLSLSTCHRGRSGNKDAEVGASNFEWLWFENCISPPHRFFSYARRRWPLDARTSKDSVSFRTGPGVVVQRGVWLIERLTKLPAQPTTSSRQRETFHFNHLWINASSI
jgi:hypothetical protein